MSESRVRQNYWAIVVAAIAAWLLAAAWYQTFMHSWLEGVNRTTEWYKTSSMPPYIPPVIALIMSAVMATAISCVTQLTGPQTAIRGIRAAFLLWLGFVFTAFLTEYTYEVRPRMLLLNAGYWLIGMVVMGAIVGGWKKKVPASIASPTTSRDQLAAR